MVEVVRLARVVDLPLDYLADDTADIPPPKPVEDMDWEVIKRMVKKLGHNEAMDRLLIPHISEITEPHETKARSRGA